MEDTNYNVVTDRGSYEDTNAIYIFGKTTTGFTATWDGAPPTVFDGGSFIVYASTPEKTIHRGDENPVGSVSSPVTITVHSEYIGPGNSTYKYTTSDSGNNGGLFGSINAIRGTTLTIYVVGDYAELVSHPLTITEYNDQGQAATPLTGVVRTDTGGQNNDGTYNLTWVVPDDTTINKYQYQCENHAHMRGTIYVSSSYTEILPVAYAYVNSSNYDTTDANNRMGVNISWSTWDSFNQKHVFTFDTAMEDNNYCIVTDRNYENTNSIEISGKNTTGFTAKWTNASPDVFDGTFILYASIPTKIISSAGTRTGEILPVAYAYVNQSNYDATDANDRRGVNISWSAWNNPSTGKHAFTFDTEMEDNNYNVVTDRDYENTNCVYIHTKTTSGFIAQWDNANPDVFWW